MFHTNDEVDLHEHSLESSVTPTIMSSWYTPPPFVTTKFVPARDEDETRAKTVHSLLAVAHAKKPGPYPGGLTNHWCLYLQTGFHESVRIDVQPNPQQAGTVIQAGFKADVIVSSLPYEFSGSATHKSMIPVPMGLVVAHVLDYIIQNGRDKYEFTKEGVGCRRWLVDTLALLVGAGWLDESAAEIATTNIGKLWPEGTPLDIGGGRYYT